MPIYRREILESRREKFFRFCASVFLSSSIYLLASSSPAHAQSMLSPNYTIRLGNFNMTSGLKSSTSYSLTDTVGQIAANYFSSTGYHVKAGFQYLYTLYDFAFSVNSLSADLGPLSPGGFSSASTVLTVTAPGQGYSVTTGEMGKLTNASSNTIPDTGCNAGCTTTSAGVWTSTSAYGFGYNMSGSDIPADFAGSTYFRPFPDLSLGGTPATVMASTAAGRGRIATATYQAAISGTQAGGTYSTQIIYIATPVY